MTLAHPQYLVETDWLEAHLSEPDLRVLDCTVLFQTDVHGVRVNNGRETWAQGHIPGSGFADLMQDLSDRDSRLPFMMPPSAQFAEAMGRYGVGEGSRVVLYDASRDRWANMWAARVWWMLRAFRGHCREQRRVCAHAVGGDEYCRVRRLVVGMGRRPVPADGNRLR